MQVSEPDSSARLMEQRNAGSAAACFVLKFWDAIAGVIAISILAVIAFFDYDRGCTPDVISSNLHMLTCSTTWPLGSASGPLRTQ